MVRTYTWNPSTQSNLTINGNFSNENKKPVRDSLPVTSSNLYSTQCFSNPTDDTQNDCASSSSEFPVCNNHLHCALHTRKFQESSLLQPAHQSCSVYYPIPLNLPASLYRCCVPILPPQITSPVMFEQTTNLNSVELLHLKPIQIGSKVYYEPVSSNSTLHSNPAAIFPHLITTANLITIAKNNLFQNSELSHLPNTTIPVLADSINGQNKSLHPETCGINHSITPSNNGSTDLTFISGNLQSRNEVQEKPSCQGTDKNSTVTTYPNPQRQTSRNESLQGGLYQYSLSHKITPSPQYQHYQKMTAVDSTEQYKRDLQLQIEQNRCRKEEERQRELEIERREMIKFEEYRRKAQQEIEEEERREKEKILTAQRRTERMRALQQEAAALKARRGIGNCTKHNDEKSQTLGERTFSNHLEWWEKKKQHVNDNAQRAPNSPVIPALRKKNETFTDLSQNTALVSNANESNNISTGRSNKSHLLQRLGGGCYHPSLTSRRHKIESSMTSSEKFSHSQKKSLSSSLL